MCKITVPSTKINVYLRNQTLTMSLRLHCSGSKNLSASIKPQFAEQQEV